MPDLPTLLLWTPPGEAALRHALGAVDVKLDVVHDADAALARLGDAEGLVLSAAHVTDAFLARLGRDARRLRWVHLTNAGYDNVAGRPLPDELVVTYTPGAGADAVAEHGVALMLALARGIPRAIARQRERHWDYGIGRNTVSLQGRTALILGFGHIGKALAQLLRAFGVTVIAASRGGAAHPLADASCTLAQIDGHLADADFVVVAAPLTRDTAGFLDAARLARMPAGAFLINLSRGAIVDTLALDARLREGQLAGAALDVTEPEPLPDDHPLWSAPNLLLTPHIAATGATPGDCARLLAITTENARRFSRGEPLLHIVDCSPPQAA